MAVIETTIPGRKPIELVAFYEEFRWYYPQCELETKRWFVENIKPNWWIFDVGANIGYYTVLFAQLGYRGQTVAFEPTVTARMLRANLHHNGIHNAEVHEIALGATTGSHRDRIIRLWGTEGEERTYEFSTFDDFVGRRKPERVDCIKIDVDGFDFDVLRGAEQTLMKHDPVIMIELNGEALAKRQQCVSEPLAWLAERGYRRALILDRENFVLQRKQRRMPLRPRAVDSIELIFPRPRRVNERLKDPIDQLATTPIVRAATLVNGAAIKPIALSTVASLADTVVGHTASYWARFRRRKEQHPLYGLPPTLQGIIGHPIETPAITWTYSLIVELGPPSSSGKLTIEVGVEVLKGKLGVLLVGQDQSQMVSHERVLSAMPGVQWIVLAAPAALIRSLIFRTVSYEGTRTVFKLKSIKSNVDTL